MRTLGSKASFWTSAGVAGLALWSSGAPSVVYPLYATDWHLSATTTTLIFAVYPLVLIPVLIVFGNLSDVTGRRFAMLLGMGALALGSLLFALAPDLALVLIGRGFMGVGVGLSLSPATAAMIEYGGPRGAARASSTTTASTATGLALATIIGGALVQYAPAPLHLTFWLLLSIVAVVSIGVWRLPRRSADAAAAVWRPRALRVPRGLRRAFVSGALGIASAYALGAVYLALGALIAADLVDSRNVFANGSILAVTAVVIGAVAVLFRRLSPGTALVIGPIATLIGLSLMVLSGSLHSLPLFVLSSVAGGAGYSFLFTGGLGVLTAAAPSRHRAAMISAAYVVGYLAQALAALGLGAIATASGLERAIVVGAPIIILIGVTATLIHRIRVPAFRGEPERPKMGLVPSCAAREEGI